MIDKKTQQVLQRISANMPKDLMAGVMKKEKTEGRETVIEQILRNERNKNFHHLIKKGKSQLEQDLENGKYSGKEKYVNDPKKAAEANAYLEAQIQKAVRSGEIKAPQNDKFMEKMRNL